MADVGALKLTAEQLAQFLQLAASGQLPMTQSNSMVGINLAAAIGQENEEDDYEEGGGIKKEIVKHMKETVE